MKKIALGVIALAMAFSFSVASAQVMTTTADAALSQFNTNLTIGSTGSDVSALQTILVNGGYLVMPAGVAKGYFGSLTKSAVATWQAAVGISPASGYFGPISRAYINSHATTGSTSTVAGCVSGAMFSSTTGAACTTTTTSTVPGCVAGAMFSSTTGQACGTTSSTGSTAGITTPGVEGILTVSQGPISSSVVNVGQTQVPVITVRAQAQNSDIAIQRIQLDLGSSTTIYNKIYSTLYVTDGTNVLASVPLNSTTVVQSGTDYYVNISGFTTVVPKGTYKDLVIKADLYPSIDSTYRQGAWTITVPSNGVRGIDGAGIDQYGPIGSVSQTITINSSLTDNAQVNIALDPSSPLTTSVAVTDTTNNQYLKLPLFTFDLYAQNDTINVKNLNVHVGTTGTGNVTAVYLYQGSNLITSAAVSNGVASFNNLLTGQVVAPVNQNTAFTIKADVSSVGSNGVTINASTSASDITAQNSVGQSLLSGNTTGSAIANPVTVTGLGPQFTLNSTPVLSKTVTNTDQNGNATSTYVGTYNIHIMAVGSDITFGLPASSTPSFATTTGGVAIYKNGVADTLANYSPIVAYSQPTNTVLSGDQKSFTVTRGNTADITVTYSFLVRNPGANTYQVQLQGINWAGTGSVGPTTYMNGQTAWRTNSQ
jgi:hypothetical protein